MCSPVSTLQLETTVVCRVHTFSQEVVEMENADNMKENFPTEGDTHRWYILKMGTPKTYSKFCHLNTKKSWNTNITTAAEGIDNRRLNI